MELRQRDLDYGSSLVVARGSLDGTTAGEFSDFLQTVLDNGARYVVLDFTNVDSVTSAGLRAVAQLGMSLAERRGRLVAHSLKAEVQELFDLSGLASLIVVCPSRDAAIAHVARER